MTTPTPFVPKAVAQLIANIAENLGFEPDLTRVGDRRMRITISHESQPRVFCTVDYKFTGNRWEWANSKLSLDGNRIPIMPDPASFYRLFKDPDSLGLKAADLAILDNLAPMPLDSPTAIQMQGITEYIQTKVSKIDAETTVELKLHQGTPALLVTMARAHMLWVIKSGQMTLSLFDLDGWDFTRRFKDPKKLAEMFGFLAEQHGIDPSYLTKESAPPPAHFNADPKTTSNAVRTRRQTVIRT